MNRKANKVLKANVRELNNAHVDIYEKQYKSAKDPFMPGAKPKDTGESISINHKHRMKKYAERNQLPIAKGAGKYMAIVKADQIRRNEADAAASKAKSNSAQQNEVQEGSGTVVVKQPKKVGPVKAKKKEPQTAATHKEIEKAIKPVVKKKLTRQKKGD